MSNPLITILTVNYKTFHFIDLMLYSFKKLTKNPYKVIICDNYSSDQEISNIERVVQRYDNVEIVFRKQTQRGSIGHAEAMDLLVSKVDTLYFVTMDADCIFLLKNWDEVLISKISDNVKAIGTTLPESTINHKPMDFPLVFAVLYETKIFKELNPSFMPGDYKIDKSKDTGWEIRKKYMDFKYKGLVFKGKNTRFDKNTPFGNVLCAVYFLDNDLIATHFGRGSSGGIAKYRSIISYLPFVRKIYLNIKSKLEIKKWMNICRKFIDKQN